MKLLVKIPAIWPETEPWSVGITSSCSLMTKPHCVPFQGNNDVLNVLHRHFHSNFKPAQSLSRSTPQGRRESGFIQCNLYSPEASGKGHQNEQGFCSLVFSQTIKHERAIEKGDFLPTAQRSGWLRKLVEQEAP